MIRIVSALILGVGLLLAASSAVAQQYTFDPRTAKKFQKVIEAVQAGDEATARKILEGINLKRAKPYARARVLQYLGNLEAQDEKYEEALASFEQCVAEEALPPEEQLRTLFLVGQLQGMMERWDDALKTLESWISQVEAPTSNAYYTLAVTYYQAGRPLEALPYARLAVESSEEPRESWYRLLLSIHLEQEQYEEALALLDDLILTYPNRQYWTQMAAIYSQLDMMPKSLAVQQLAKAEDYLKEGKDLIRIAQMSMVQGIPHRGAQIMKDGLEGGTIEPSELAYSTYSDTLLQSREWALALEPLSKAAEMKEDGSLFVRVAQVNLQLGRWGDARKALKRAFEKGGLTDEGQAHILDGIAAANDRKWAAATRSFDRASRFDGTAEVAVKWKGYVAREKARLGGG